MPKSAEERTKPLTKKQKALCERCRSLIERFCKLRGYKPEIYEHYEVEVINGVETQRNYKARLYVLYGEANKFQFSFGRVETREHLPVIWYHALNEIARGDLIAGHGWQNIRKCKTIDEFELNLTIEGG